MQMFDIKDPRRPRNVGYFIPPQPGSLDDYLSYPRDTDNVFVEWDRSSCGSAPVRALSRRLAVSRQTVLERWR